MRDRRFVAVHRVGALDLERHRQLAAWAADCAEHVLALFDETSADDRPQLAIARAWAPGEVPVGVAQQVAALYARKAQAAGGLAVEQEEACQTNRLPGVLRQLVISTLERCLTMPRVD